MSRVSRRRYLRVTVPMKQPEYKSKSCCWLHTVCRQRLQLLARFLPAATPDSCYSAMWISSNWRYNQIQILGLVDTADYLHVLRQSLVCWHKDAQLLHASPCQQTNWCLLWHVAARTQLLCPNVICRRMRVCVPELTLCAFWAVHPHLHGFHIGTQQLCPCSYSTCPNRHQWVCWHMDACNTFASLCPQNMLLHETQR